MAEPELLPGFLGNWEFPPSILAEGVSFGMSGAAPEPAPTWRLDLPANPQAAEAKLAEAEQQLAASQSALEAVPGRVDGLVRRVQAEATGEVSFAAAPLSPAEAELLRMLEALEPGSSQVSFGLGETLSGGWEAARQELQSLIDRITQLVTHFAWVETLVEGRALARSRIGWTGDLGTLWSASAKPKQIPLHRRSLELALASRQVTLRMFILTTQSAAKLSVLLATPGGAVLALPAAWKFVNQTLAEIQKYQELSKQEESN